MLARGPQWGLQALCSRSRFLLQCNASGTKATTRCCQSESLPRHDGRRMACYGAYPTTVSKGPTCRRRRPTFLQTRPFTTTTTTTRTESSSSSTFSKPTRPQRPSVPFVIQRGGTSKGIFFHKDDLPVCPDLRDAVIKDAFGSPDIRQIDGLGGADVLTSKVAIVNKRTDSVAAAAADVDYLFGQVEFGGHNNSDSNSILYDVNCGNISAGVGPFAIEEGLIDVRDDTVTTTIDGSLVSHHQTVRIYNVNTGKVILAEVPVERMAEQDHWRVVEEGPYEIDGVPGTAACVPLDFSKCVGTLDRDSEQLLPTGNIRDSVVVDGRAFDVSLVDVANFVVHIDGRQLGLTGDESSAAILNDNKLWNTVRAIRYEAAKLVLEEHEITLTKPFASVVFPFLHDCGYESIRGDLIADDSNELETKNDDDESDIRSRFTPIDFRAFVLFCDHPHKAYPGTASNATAAAALIDGTVVNNVLVNNNRPIGSSREKLVTIGHPSGRMVVSSKVEESMRSKNDNATEVPNEYRLKRSIIGRTSRRIADGRLYPKPDTVQRLMESKQ